MDQADVIRWLVAVGIAVGIWLLGWIVRRVLLAGIVKLIRRTPTDLDDILIDAFKPHLPVWFLVLGVAIGARYSGLPESIVARVDRGATAVFLLSVTFAVAAFAGRLVASRASRLPGAVATTTLTQNAVRIAVIAIGAMVVISNLGIAITPVLTALGVGSLAVALALQPTLANLFAGFHLTLANQIRVGDYVELETGQIGYVADIGWRNTEIREMPNNIVLVPNSRLAEIIVRNYSLPSNEQSVLVPVGVSYSSDLEKVARVTLEVAREVLREVPGGVAEFEPLLRYHTFGDSSINFNVILRVREYVDRFPVTSEFVTRLHRRYDAEEIEIPFPQRVVHFPGGPPPAAGAPEAR